MLDTLINLLQDESKRICGKTLPPEICRYILIQCGGWQASSAIAWKGMEQYKRSQLRKIRDKWRCFNAIITQKRNDNDPLYYSVRVCLYDNTAFILGDYRFWFPLWALHECLDAAFGIDT